MAKKKHADTIESMELCEGVYLQDGKYRFLSDGI